MFDNCLLFGSTNSNYKTRKECCDVNNEKSLRYVLFSSHKWENVPENKNKVIPINIEFIGKKLELGWYKVGGHLQQN